MTLEKEILFAGRVVQVPHLNIALLNIVSEIRYVVVRTEKLWQLLLSDDHWRLFVGVCLVFTLIL